MNDFTLLITNWYRQNKRNLPWRQTNDPYFIWLSEIILQQTRVDQGLAYYNKFIQHYPTVHDLANAEEIDVLNDWQGLGYYSRARNLHFSAKLISEDLKGVFPNNYNDILSLKGVGKYTAAAIASFVYNEQKAVVDGNVYRVLSRVFDIATPIDSTQGTKEFQALADELIPSKNPGEHNQAIMEIGAVVCTPKPNCTACPLVDICLSLANSNIQSRPIKAKRTKVRDRYFHYLIYSDEENVIIEQRTNKDIWQNMYQFPLLEAKSANADELSETWKHQDFQSNEITHILSHQKIHATFHHCSQIPDRLEQSWIVIPKEKIQDYPLPRIIDKYLSTDEGVL